MNQVENLLAAYKAGVLTDLWLCSAFLAALEPNDVDKYMNLFPANCCDQLRKMVAHDPSPDMVNIGGGPMVREETVMAIRDWFARHDKSGPK